MASFSGSNRFILDYLIEEVLNRQPEPIQQFLIQTSILERLCGPLCAAILGEGAQPGAELMLRQLESSNLFLFPLDQQRYWYRYHQLFADLLRKRLLQSAPDIVRELHRRAVEWHEENGLIPSAIHHAFQMQDFSKAAALVARITEMMWGRGEHATLLAWMNALPNAEKGAYPHLLTFQVSMLISAGKLKEAEACIPILEQYIAAALEANPDQPALLGSVSELRTYIASFYNDRTAVFQNAQTALKYLTRDEDSGKRCGVSLVLGHAYLSAGNLEAATATFAEAVASGKKAGKPSMTLTGLSNLAVALCLQGGLSRAAQICAEGRQLIEAHHLDRSPMAVDIRLVWGWVLCERGVLDEAEPVIRGGLEMALEQQFTWQAAWGQQAIARLLLARGRLAEAESAAQDAEQWAAAHPVPPHITCRGAGLLAEIWLRQGKMEQAERFLRARQIPLDGAVQFPRQTEQLAWARLACLRGDAEAGELLERVSAWAEDNRQTGARIAALLLRALLSQSLGKREEGLHFLGHALEIAQSEGYVQCFADEGEPGAALLREAVKRDTQAAYAARLLTAFGALPAGSAVEPRGPEKREPDHAASSDILPLVEPLSKREMETLLLIAEGLSNKEIAQRMCISLRTVKYYSTGLYNKLGVDSRMQAVNRARALGLI